jgi:drug/metabolite transporter (DMT)-like permease
MDWVSFSILPTVIVAFRKSNLMPSLSNPAVRGFLLVLLASAGYAFFPIFTRMLYADGRFGALDVLVWRFLLAAPVIWIALNLIPQRADANNGVPTPDSGKARLPVRGLLLMGGLFAVLAATALMALERLPASAYIVIIYTYPALVALLSLVILRERLPGIGWLALGLTLIGVVLTVPTLFSDLQQVDADRQSVLIAGVIFTLVNALLYALYIVLSGRLLRGQSELAKASAWGITGSAVVAAVVLLLRGPVMPGTLTEWGALVGIVIISTVIPVFAFYAGIRLLGAARASIVATVEPVMTLTLAALILNERMEPIQLVGAALIIASVVLLQVDSLRKRA